jgi:hypothetical protein
MTGILPAFDPFQSIRRTLVAPWRGGCVAHVNGAGCNPGAADDVPVMPFAGDVTSSPSADTKDAVYAANFSHDDESATPGRLPGTVR